MALGKWIGGILGFMSGGPLGALAGIVLGHYFDNMLDGVNSPETQGTFDGYSGYQARAAQGQRNIFDVGASLLYHQGRRQGNAL